MIFLTHLIIFSIIFITITVIYLIFSPSVQFGIQLSLILLLFILGSPLLF